MNETIGMIEVYGVAHSIIIADSMLKIANVHIISIEDVSQAYYTILIGGDLDSVLLAIENGEKIAVEVGVLIASKVIARPMKETMAILLKNHE